MKKIGRFIKKHKNRIICVVILLLVVFWWCLRLGLVTPPKYVVLWYFNNNRETFDYIAEYVEENPETTINIIYMENGKIRDIQDSRLQFFLIKLLKFGGFERIFYSPCNGQIRFCLSNFIVRKGEGFEIVYSTKVLHPNYIETYSDDEKYGYERIDGNWYYKYRIK